MTRKSSLSKTMALMTTIALAGCGGGDAEIEPATDDVAVVEPGADAPAPMPPAGGAPAPPTAAGDLPAGVNPEMVAAGRQVFVGQGLCFTCHGQEAQGTPLAPSLTDDTWLNIDNPDQDLEVKLTTLIRTGVAQPIDHPAPMPPMGGAQLSEEQLNSVVAYVMSL